MNTSELYNDMLAAQLFFLSFLNPKGILKHKIEIAVLYDINHSCLRHPCLFWIFNFYSNKNAK